MQSWEMPGGGPGGGSINAIGHLPNTKAKQPTDPAL